MGEEPRRLPCLVVIGLRERERDALPVDQHLAAERLLAALAELAAVPRREQRDRLGADVVARALVLGPRVAHADDEQVGRRPAPVATEHALLAFGSGFALAGLGRR